MFGHWCNITIFKGLFYGDGYTVECFGYVVGTDGHIGTPRRSFGVTIGRLKIVRTIQKQLGKGFVQVIDFLV